MLMVNDSEARELCGDWNIHRAGRWILRQGPRRVVIKQGEYGALLIEPTAAPSTFPPFRWRPCSIPPGRATRSPAGSWPTSPRTGEVSEDNIRRAMVYGAAMGSYAVEQFGIRGFERITLSDVEARVRAFRDLTHVRLAEPLREPTVRPGGGGPGQRRCGQGSGSAELVAGTRTALSVGDVGAFGGMVRIPAGMRRPTLVMSTDGVGTKVLVALQAGRFDSVGEDLVNHSVNDILVHGATPIAFMDYVAGAGL